MRLPFSSRIAFFLFVLRAGTSAAAAPAFDLDPYSATEVSPGAYRAFGDALCAATNMPGARVMTLRARVRPERCDSPQTGSLGVAAYFSPDDYWQLALIKPSQVSGNAGRRDFELKARTRGVWGGEKNVARRIVFKQSAQWERGRKYDLSLACSPERVEGEIRDAESGEVVFRAEYALAADSAKCKTWRPALRAGGWFEGTISGVEASCPEAPTSPGAAAKTAAEPAAPPPYIPSGPETGLRGAATGFFHIETIDGRDWPIDPVGRAVILAGTQHINPQGVFSDAVGFSPYGRFVATNYPSVDVWADETLSRLDDWGFTMLGNACSLGVLAHKTLPHVVNLKMGQRVSRGDPDWFILEFGFKPCSALPNVFHPQFAAACEWRAREMCAPCKDDPWLVGWFIDNELAWWGSGRRIRTTGVYAAVAHLPKAHSARRTLDAFLAERGAAVDGAGGLRAPSFEDKAEFMRLYARTYYEKTVSAIRKADPNHMVLGSRYAGLTGASPEVWEEAGKLCDVVTFNCYPWADLDEGVVYDAEGGVPMTERLREYHGYAKAPLMVTEWSFSALDHGHPCTVGAGQRFRTQAERVEASMLFAKTLLADPHVAGYDYFKWVDQPRTGSSRFAPENCNYGLVNDDGVPYEGLTSAFKALHGDLVRWRLSPPPAPRAATRDEPPPSERERFFAEGAGAWNGGAATPPEAVRGFPDAAASRTGAPVASGVGFTLESDGFWRLSNGLVRLSGRIGSKWLADDVAFAGGRSVGRLGALLAAEEDDFYRWIDTSRLESAEFSRDEATGAASVTLRGLGGRAANEAPRLPAPGAEAPGSSPPETAPGTALSFAISMRVTLLPGHPDALVELLGLENRGDEPLKASALYMRPFSRDRQTASRRDAMPQLWGAPRTATWTIPGGGEWGLSSIDRSVRKFRFFVTPKDGVQHPDAAFSPVHDCETFTVAPGETWRADIPMGATLSVGASDDSGRVSG